SSNIINQTNHLVIQIGTFCMGDMLLNLLYKLKGHNVFLWGLEDPIVEDYDTIPLNSLTGFNMATSFMKRLNLKYDFSYGQPLKTTINQIKIINQVINLKEDLKKVKVGIIGTRVPGFYLSEVDHLKLKDHFGIECVYKSVATLVIEAKAIAQERVNSALQQVIDNYQVVVDTAMIEKNIRIELALLDYQKEANITGFAIECWPDFQTLYQCGVCSVLSALVDQKIMASCEADVLGFLTMYIQHSLTKEIPFFCDLVSANHERNVLKAWHCGQGPKSLAASNVSYTSHPTMRNDLGASIQYEMKLGQITLNKVSLLNDTFRIFSTAGHTITVDTQLTGTQTDIKLDQPLQNVLTSIVDNGIEHHYSIIHSDLKAYLPYLSKYLNLEVIEVF
ncbi:MAG: hypothetical protein ACRCTA_02455, partial [Bacilli bacterium]